MKINVQNSYKFSTLAVQSNEHWFLENPLNITFLHNAQKVPSVWSAQMNQGRLRSRGLVNADAPEIESCSAEKLWSPPWTTRWGLRGNLSFRKGISQVTREPLNLVATEERKCPKDRILATVCSCETGIIKKKYWQLARMSSLRGTEHRDTQQVWSEGGSWEAKVRGPPAVSMASNAVCQTVTVKCHSATY